MDERKNEIAIIHFCIYNEWNNGWINQSFSIIQDGED